MISDDRRALLSDGRSARLSAVLALGELSALLSDGRSANSARCSRSSRRAPSTAHATATQLPRATTTLTVLAATLATAILTAATPIAASRQRHPELDARHADGDLSSTSARHADGEARARERQPAVDGAAEVRRGRRGARGGRGGGALGPWRRRAASYSM